MLQNIQNFPYFSRGNLLSPAYALRNFLAVIDNKAPTYSCNQSQFFHIEWRCFLTDKKYFARPSAS
jgi:hypothetical protein